MKNAPPENTYSILNSVQDKKSITQIIETLPVPMKTFVSEEFELSDKRVAYHVRALQKKILELQVQLRNFNKKKKKPLFFTIRKIISFS